MADLETRLRALADLPPAPAPTVDELRRRAGHRRRRKRVLSAILVLPVLAVAATLVVRSADEPTPEVRTVPAEPEKPDPGTVTIGDVDGVSISVTPDRDLHDGDLVEVRVDGLERLPGASFVMCAGDVTERSALADCDLEAVQLPGGQPARQPRATAKQTVSVSRVLLITRGSSDPNTPHDYDCATEPTGCILAVGPLSIPPRGVGVPLHFEPSPLATPVVRVSPADGLTNDHEITVTAEGLRPNAVARVMQCRTEPFVHDEGTSELCDASSEVTTDEAGRLTHRFSVWATLYTWQGLVDCTVEDCAVAVSTGPVRTDAKTPIRFAPGTPVPTPRLSIDPEGPYADGQVVTVTGTGFRPGMDLGMQIAQCPNDKDTRVEERCGYPMQGPAIADDQGRFTVRVRLSSSLAFTGSCVDGPGCHLGWVITHGPTLAKVPLTFRE